MMIKFVDFLNKHLANLDKKNYKYECSYIWASLFANFLFVLMFVPFLGLGLIIGSGVIASKWMIEIGLFFYEKIANANDKILDRFCKRV